MAYNKQFNARNRFNSPGHFVSSGEQPVAMSYQIPSPPLNTQPNQNLPSLQTADVVMKLESDDNLVSKNDDPERPTWMKSKLTGLKKISNKERRRRQNAHLRRLLTPKNAVMVLNEMMPNEQVTNQYKVEPAPMSYYQQPNVNFCADLTLQGTNYKGYGENKMVARNNAAEQAVRDIVLKKMTKLVHSDSESMSGDGVEEDVLPMIQLASFALHKLFTEWEFEGHRVPQLRPTGTSVSEQTEEEEGGTGGAGAVGGTGGAPPAKASKAKGPKAVPVNAAAMHPCMLLTYLRANLEYRELAAEGERAQDMLYTMSVDVDGNTYIGKGQNKKEARKNAAVAACQDLFGVTFDAKPTSNVPIPPTA